VVVLESWCWSVLGSAIDIGEMALALEVGLGAELTSYRRRELAWR